MSLTSQLFEPPPTTLMFDHESTPNAAYIVDESKDGNLTKEIIVAIVVVLGERFHLFGPLEMFADGYLSSIRAFPEHDSVFFILLIVGYMLVARKSRPSSPLLPTATSSDALPKQSIQRWLQGGSPFGATGSVTAGPSDAQGHAMTSPGTWATRRQSTLSSLSGTTLQGEVYPPGLSTPPVVHVPPPAHLAGSLQWGAHAPSS